MIIVLNHTSGVDPVLAIAACPFEIRWIMASDMRYPLAEGFWQWARVIFVDRKKRDASGTREAMKHLGEGGVLGIFPEGGIEDPPRLLRPFQAGVGLIIRKTGAPVLPVVITGIEHRTTVSASFWKRGHAVLEFKPIIRFAPDMSAAEIAAQLQQRYIEWTGWPVADHGPDATEHGPPATAPLQTLA
jgi:1-acyl-sn-glycerol-3-phosphate acyltransferase